MVAAAAVWMTALVVARVARTSREGLARDHIRRGVLPLCPRRRPAPGGGRQTSSCPARASEGWRRRWRREGTRACTRTNSPQQVECGSHPGSSVANQGRTNSRHRSRHATLWNSEHGVRDAAFFFVPECGLGLPSGQVVPRSTARVFSAQGDPYPPRPPSLVISCSASPRPYPCLNTISAVLLLLADGGATRR